MYFSFQNCVIVYLHKILGHILLRPLGSASSLDRRDTHTHRVNVSIAEITYLFVLLFFVSFSRYHYYLGHSLKCAVVTNVDSCSFGVCDVRMRNPSGLILSVSSPPDRVELCLCLCVCAWLVWPFNSIPAPPLLVLLPGFLPIIATALHAHVTCSAMGWWARKLEWRKLEGKQKELTRKGNERTARLRRRPEELGQDGREVWNLTIGVRVGHLFVGHHSGRGIVDLSVQRLRLVWEQIRKQGTEHVQTVRNPHHKLSPCSYFIFSAGDATCMSHSLLWKLQRTYEHTSDRGQ